MPTSSSQRELQKAVVVIMIRTPLSMNVPKNSPEKRTQVQIVDLGSDPRKHKLGVGKENRGKKRATKKAHFQGGPSEESGRMHLRIS